MHIVFRLLCVAMLYGFNVLPNRLFELIPLFIINEQYLYFMYINYIINGIMNTLFINILLFAYYATTYILESYFYDKICDCWIFVTDFIKNHQTKKDYKKMMLIPNALNKIDTIKEKIKTSILVFFMGKNEINEFIENDSHDENDDITNIDNIIDGKEIQKILNSKGFQKLLNKIIK